MASVKTTVSDLVVCHGCDYLMEKLTVGKGKRSRCPRCGTIIHRRVHNSLQKSTALSLAGLLIFFPAIYMPLMTFTVAGLHGSGNILDAVLTLFEKDYLFVGFMVLLVSVVFPFVKLSLLFITSLSLAIGHVTKLTIHLFKLYKHLSEWAMVEVYMLGILVSIIKMIGMADIAYNTGFYSFIALVLLTIGASTVVDEDYFWDRIEKLQVKETDGEKTYPFSPADMQTAQEAGLIRCEDCGKLVFNVAITNNEMMMCPRCFSAVHSRKPNSIARTWALVITAAILYIPANILPIMRVDFLGTPDSSTILDGIIYFFQHGEYFVGGVILTASVLVPMFKIVGIIIILITIQFRRRTWLKHKTGMFRFIEFIGRWSFIDIFVIALLGALVQFGALTTIGAEPAARYFTGVVIATMFAAIAFDPRILWDAAREIKQERDVCPLQS